MLERSWYQTHLCMLINWVRVMPMRQPGGFGGHFGARGTAAVLRICYGNTWRLLQHRGNLRQRPSTCVHEALRHLSMPAIW